MSPVASYTVTDFQLGPLVLDSGVLSFFTHHLELMVMDARDELTAPLALLYEALRSFRLNRAARRVRVDLPSADVDEWAAAHGLPDIVKTNKNHDDDKNKADMDNDDIDDVVTAHFVLGESDAVDFHTHVIPVITHAHRTRSASRASVVTDPIVARRNEPSQVEPAPHSAKIPRGGRRTTDDAPPDAPRRPRAATQRHAATPPTAKPHGPHGASQGSGHGRGQGRGLGGAQGNHRGTQGDVEGGGHGGSYRHDAPHGPPPSPPRQAPAPPPPPPPHVTLDAPPSPRVTLRRRPTVAAALAALPAVVPARVAATADDAAAERRRTEAATEGDGEGTVYDFGDVDFLSSKDPTVEETRKGKGKREGKGGKKKEAGEAAPPRPTVAHRRSGGKKEAEKDAVLLTKTTKGKEDTKLAVSENPRRTVAARTRISPIRAKVASPIRKALSSVSTTDSQLPRVLHDAQERECAARESLCRLVSKLVDEDESDNAFDDVVHSAKELLLCRKRLRSVSARATTKALPPSAIASVETLLRRQHVDALHRLSACGDAHRRCTAECLNAWRAATTAFASKFDRQMTELKATIDSLEVSMAATAGDIEAQATRERESYDGLVASVRGESSA